jgi:hypothetical protein
MTEARQSVTAAERVWLRDVARKYLEYAARPVMAERTELWYAHNELKGPRPVVVFEAWPVLGEFMPPPHCQSPLAREIESQLLEQIVMQDAIGDDKVITPEFHVGMEIHLREYDIDITRRHAADAKGRCLGFEVDYPITDLVAQLPGMKPSVYRADRESTLAHKAAVEEVIGDLMPVRIENNSQTWYGGISGRLVMLMGMERMFLEMIEHPEAVKELFRFVVDDMLTVLRWQEREGLLTPNNANQYAGAGSYGFSRELTPRPGHVRLADLWGNLNSQETVGLSPGMFEEFAFPAYCRLASEFGLIYYGCCEGVHDIWDRCISRLPHLRKVSISPWCDEAFIGERLRGTPVIYSRKPSPNYIGVGRFDEDAFTAHIAATLRAARGCRLEIIFRDIYALDGDLTKPARAVAIVRKLIDEMW